MKPLYDTAGKRRWTSSWRGSTQMRRITDGKARGCTCTWQRWQRRRRTVASMRCSEQRHRRLQSRRGGWHWVGYAPVVWDVCMRLLAALQRHACGAAGSGIRDCKRGVVGGWHCTGWCATCLGVASCWARRFLKGRSCACIYWQRCKGKHVVQPAVAYATASAARSAAIEQRLQFLGRGACA